MCGDHSAVYFTVFSKHIDMTHSHYGEGVFNNTKKLRKSMLSELFDTHIGKLFLFLGGQRNFTA